MSLTIKNYFVFLLLSIAGWGTAKGQGTEPLKIMHYNLLRFGNGCDPISINQKAAWLETILNFYQPDILTVNELVPEVAFETLIEQATQSYNPAMEAAGFTNEAGSEIVNDLFFNSDKMGLKGVDVLPGAFRDINVYTFFSKEVLGANVSDTLFFHCIVAHFKAGGDEEDRLLRTQETREVLTWVKADTSRENIVFMGDLNFDNAAEEGWDLLVNPDSGGLFVDPLNLIEDWNGPDFASIHTQSTRTTTPDCGVAGGLDDRFDFILLGPQSNEAALSYVSESYQALGNDGGSFNEALACGGGEVPEIICNTLRSMSDHLPVVMEVEMGNSPVSEKENLFSGGIDIPSPVGSSLYIDLRDLSQRHSFEVSLFSVSGKRSDSKWMGAATSSISLPIHHLAPGIYWVELSFSNGVRVGKKVLKLP